MKNLSSLLLIFFISSSIFSQFHGWEKTLLKNNVKPPELGALSFNILYDNVDLSTGRIHPSIPFFSIGTDDLLDQIGISYISGSGIKVNDYASDIGLGWDLNAGGYIVREVRGIPDDSTCWPNGNPDYQEGDPIPLPDVINGQAMLNGWLDFANWGGIIRGFGYPQSFIGLPINPINNNTVGYEINNFIENFKNGIISHIRSRPSFMVSLGMDLSDLSGSGVMMDIMMDGQPDVFHFKCPGGYSGKFIFDENGIPVHVPYNPNIKISSPVGPNSNEEGKWIITIENGSKFHFPHNANYYEKTRTETTNYPYTDDWSHETPDKDEGIFVSEYVSKWHLSKAESITGNQLEYSYENEPDFESETLVEVQQDFHAPGRGEQGDSSPPPHTAFDYGSTTSRTTPRDRKEIISFKKRLSQVECSNGSKVILTYNGIDREDVTNHKKALGTITLKNVNNVEIEKYIFNQDNFKYSISMSEQIKRLRLYSISKQDRQGAIHDDFYNFQYYTTSPLPEGGYISLNIPERNSYKQDFWGYYNKNLESTLIPAIDNLEDGYRRTLPGADRSPDEERTKANVLKKISFPTGGSVEYEYELNDFKSDHVSFIADDKKVPTGGLRIKSIIQKEIDNSPLMKNFSYVLPDAPDTSSGQIPVHLRKWKRNGAGRLFDKSTRYYWYGYPGAAIYVTRYSYLKYLQSSDLIRYSYVTVEENGKGKIIYRLSAFDDYPDQEKTRVRWELAPYRWGIDEEPDLTEMYANDTFTSYSEHAGIPGDRSPSPPISLTDKSYLRGLMLNVKEFKEASAIPVKETTNTYTINPDGFEARKIYALDSNAPWEVFGEFQDFLDFDLNTLNFDISSHDLDLVLLKKKETRELVQNDKYIETSHEYTYNHEFNTLKDEKFIDSNSSELVLKKYYPSDTNISGLPYMSDLMAQNRNTEQILEEKYKDNFLISKQQIGYNQYQLSNGNNAILPYSLSLAIGNNPLETETEITARDNRANVTEISKKDGTYTLYIWGYNDMYPIAKIEGPLTFLEANERLYNSRNINFDTLQRYSRQDIDNSTEQILRNALNILRDELKDYMGGALITTYTYDPLIGVTSITNPRGQTTYYHYDEFNRLESVTDQYGKLLSENKYNYKQ